MKVNKIAINKDEDYIRLDNLIKFGGIVATGGQAKLLIQAGEILLNGEVCTQRGRKVVKGDRVQFGEFLLEVVKAD